MALSGIYDLAPVLRSFLREETNISGADVTRFSPITWLARPRPPGSLALRVGAEETQEMRRQSDAFATTLRHRGIHVDSQTVAHRHHMNIVMDLDNPDEPLTQLVVREALSAGL